MRALGRVLLGLSLLVLLLVLGLLSPVIYVELACRGEPVAVAPEAILPPAHRRPESNTLLTYPEWHIVHAYDDYAAVIRTGDPHDFRFLSAIGGFWSSLCSLTERSAAMGGPSPDYHTMVHVIGVSFTAEMLAKAAYEETLGRVATWIRGPEPAPLDGLSARQAADYAGFLQQVPWYRWDFRADADALGTAATGAFRDRERALALGLEYRFKAAYARLIEKAVAATGGDELTLRSIVTGLAPELLSQVEGVTVIGRQPEGVEIETPRYRAFTRIAKELAGRGADFVEIAGNDEILLTAIAERPGGALADDGVIAGLPRQGNPGRRELRLIRVADLGETLRDGSVAVEHIHDY